MGLRILNVTWMQNECLLSIVSENWTHMFKSRKLKSYFLVSGIWTLNFKFRKSEMHCMEHWAKKLSKTSPQSLFKTRLDTFGDHYEHFWNFETFLIFLKILESSTIHGTLGEICFRTNRPKTCSKQVWTLLRMILGHSGFLKFLKDSTPHGTLGKNFLEKIAPKHVQNTFARFWERFWAFLEFWIFFDFFETLRRRDPPWNTGHSFFRKKLPQNMFKTSLDNFGNDLRHFCNFAFFLIFSKTSDDSMNTEHKNVSKKNAPRLVWTLGNNFGHFWNFERFLIFFMFSF